MVTAVKLLKFGFDVLENNPSAAYIVEELGIFIGDERLTAHGKIAAFLQEQGEIQPYLGWDGQIYPQYKTEMVYLK